MSALTTPLTIAQSLVKTLRGYKLTDEFYDASLSRKYEVVDLLDQAGLLENIHIYNLITKAILQHSPRKSKEQWVVKGIRKQRSAAIKADQQEAVDALFVGLDRLCDAMFRQELPVHPIGTRPEWTAYLGKHASAVHPEIYPKDVNSTLLKVAIVDIENTPLLSWTWERWQQNVIAVEDEWYMLAWAAKWLGEPTGTVRILPDYPTYKNSPKDDSTLATELWTWLDQADVIIGHNVARFDLPKINTRFIKAGLPPPSPYKIIDTLTVARKNFAFSSNKLGDLCEFLGTPHKKLDAGGKGTWLGCMHGDPNSWATMAPYCLEDIFAGEDVYMALRPWDPNHPNLYLDNPVDFQCPVCGGPTRFSHYRACKSYRTRRYVCVDTANCGKWSSGRREKIQAEVLS